MRTIEVGGRLVRELGDIVAIKGLTDEQPQPVAGVLRDAGPRLCIELLGLRLGANERVPGVRELQILSHGSRHGAALIETHRRTILSSLVLLMEAVRSNTMLVWM